MQVKEFMLERMTVEEFAEKHGLIMEVHERSAEDSPDRFYAHFENSDITGDGVLIGAFGNGATAQEAIKNYAEEISGKVLAIDAWTVLNRRNIPVPILVGHKP